MDFFFNPRGVAVIGASSNPLKGGHVILQNLIKGFQGAIYPVNPGYGDIDGFICYPDIADVPDPVDLAIIFVPAKAVPQTVRGCAKRGLKGVIVESGGFAETGREGKKIHEELITVIRETGIRVWGPNCMGLVDTVKKNVFSFVSSTIWDHAFIKSDVSLVVQSGMLSAGFLIDLMSHGLMGISKACSIGNKIDVNECDVLEYLIDDPDTGTIGLYLESIVDGRRFFDLLKRTAKPVVVLKGGKSEKGAEAAMSHTASLSGNGKVVSGALAQAGVTEAKDFRQMMDLLFTFSAFKNLPPMKGKDIIVLTYSGAAGILTSDFVEELGIGIAPLTGPTKEALQSVFPVWMPVSNPVDMWPAIEKNGRKKVYDTAFMVAISDPNIHGILFHSHVGKGVKQPDKSVFEHLAQAAGKPIVCWSMGDREALAAFNSTLREAGIPVFGELYRAIECLSALIKWKQAPSPASPSSPSLRETSTENRGIDLRGKTGAIDEFLSKQILSAAGIPVVPERIVSSEEDGIKAALAIGFPVVLKGIFPNMIHKSEHGLVRLDIHTDERLRQSFRELNQKAAGKGEILIQKQIKGQIELIAGFVRDPQFGPAVMIGFGGVFAEVLKDTAFALAPLSHADALKMIDRLQSKKLLNGYRGMAPLERDIMAHILVKLGAIGVANPEIAEIDINPFILCEGKPVAVDASIILK